MLLLFAEWVESHFYVPFFIKQLGPPLWSHLSKQDYSLNGLKFGTIFL